MSLENLAERQIEKRLEPWYSLNRSSPAQGWLNTIRRALGMSSPQLADRLGMTRQAVADLEARERDGSVSLGALRRAADALHCDLVYAIVPRESLADLLKTQARLRAAAEIRRVAHTMTLESQGTSEGEVTRLIEERTAQLLRGSRRVLWGKVEGHQQPNDQADME